MSKRERTRRERETKEEEHDAGKGSTATTRREGEEDPNPKFSSVNLNVQSLHHLSLEYMQFLNEWDALNLFQSIPNKVLFKRWKVQRCPFKKNFKFATSSCK